MDYKRIDSFKQLAEAIQKHIEFAYDYDPGVEGIVNNSPHALNYFLGEDPNYITSAQLAFVRLKKETKIEGLPGEVPNDATDLMNLCLEADKILRCDGKKVNR